MPNKPTKQRIVKASPLRKPVGKRKKPDTKFVERAAERRQELDEMAQETERTEIFKRKPIP
jgi:hypothetical protein